MRRFVIWMLPVLLVGLLNGFSRGAAAADAMIGEAWERGVRDGVQRQDRERTKRQAETILRQAKLLAARPVRGSQRVVRVYLLARAYGIAGDGGSARDTYRELLGLAPRCYNAYHDLAMLDLARTPPDTRSAETNLRRAIGINPGYLTAQRKLSMVLLKADRVDEAIDFLRRIVDGEPADLQARYLLARTLLGRDRLAEAEREVAMLVRKEPSSPAFQELKAEVYVKRGRLDDALGVYRRLALANPGSKSPLQGYLRCLDMKRESGEDPDIDHYLWALEGLLRLEQDPELRSKLQQAIEDMRGFQARVGLPAGKDGAPPSDDDIAKRMHEFPDEARTVLHRYIYSRKEPPSAALLRAVMGRLSPRAEPLPAVRAWALRILGRFGGFGLVGLVRHSLNDPSSEVRPVAVDTIVQLARTGGGAEATAVLVLGRAALSRDGAMATAARAGLAELVKAPLEGGDQAAQRSRFRAWWEGPTGTSAKLEALAQYALVKEPRPEDVLLPYLRDANGHVVLGAWRALETEAARMLASGRTLDPARKAWLGSIPRVPANAPVDVLAVAKPKLDAWAAAQPPR